MLRTLQQRSRITGKTISEQVEALGVLLEQGKLFIATDRGCLKLTPEGSVAVRGTAALAAVIRSGHADCRQRALIGKGGPNYGARRDGADDAGTAR